MPAHEHLSDDQLNRYVLLHRGFYDKTMKEIDINRLGVHWVSDEHPGAAWNFAQSEFGEQNRGVVVSGFVHRRHLMDPESDDYEQWINTGEGSYEPEHETPLRPGTPVHIIKSTDAYSGKERVYKKPLRGRA